MSHKPNLLSWDQDVAALRHHFVSFTKPITTAQTLPPISHLAVLFFSSYQVFETFIPPKIIVNYSFLFFKCFVIRARQKKFPDLQKIIIFCKNNEQKKIPAILKIIDLWSDVTLVVISRPMFTLETPPPSWITLSKSHATPLVWCVRAQMKAVPTILAKSAGTVHARWLHMQPLLRPGPHTAPPPLVNAGKKSLKKKNNNNNNNLDNSFWTPSFQELFAFKNSILHLKWR